MGYEEIEIVEIMSEDFILQLSDVSVSFGDKHLFKNLNLELKSNEVLGITGCSGSGKSTILRIIIDLLSPNSGEIVVLGKSVSDWDPRELRRNLILVPQESQMFPNTVRDNLTWGLAIRNETIEDNALVDILDEVNLSSIDLDDEAFNLSGGEKQRVAIARALVMNPKALLLDEPTSALDTKSALAVEDVLEEVIERHNIGILMVTHNVEQAQRFASRVVNIGGGGA